jgi:uncharacterized membrane protein
VVSPRGLGSGEGRLETMISRVLITGVALSLVLEAAGLFLLYRSWGGLAISHDNRVILRAPSFFIFLGQLASASFSGWPLRLITLGLMILILTPYVRTLLSVVYFASERNLTYLAVTLFVLLVLTASLLIH